MKTEDILSILSIVKNKSGEVKSIIEDIQVVSEKFSVIAKSLGDVAGIAKGMVEKIEEISKVKK